MNSRIDYIDRLKGLTIFLVVMGHVYGMAFSQSNDIFYKFIYSFHMPLFMFLSSLVACSGVITNTRYLCNSLFFHQYDSSKGFR